MQKMQKKKDVTEYFATLILQHWHCGIDVRGIDVHQTQKKYLLLTV